MEQAAEAGAASRGRSHSSGSSNPGFESPRGFETPGGFAAEDVELDTDSPAKDPDAFYTGDDVQGSGDGQPGSLSEYVDWALAIAGGAGRYQNRVNFLLGAPWMYGGMQTIIFVFVTLPPHRRHHCTQQGQHCHYEPIPDGDCAVARGEYEYTNVDDTLSAEWDLICETSLYVPLLSTVFFLGFLIGVYVFGALADSRGRRPAFLWSWLLMQAGAFMATVAPSYGVYAAARCLTGVGVGGFGLVAYVWNAEFLGPEKRSILVLTTNMFFALGTLLMPLLSLVLPRWRHTTLATFVLGLPYLWTYRLCVESPKWLAGRGLASEVHAVLCGVARGNGRPEPPPPSEPVCGKAAGGVQAGDGSGGKAPGANKAAGAEEVFDQLCCDSRLAIRFYIMSLAWFSLSLGYYGLSMNVSNLGSDTYTSSVLASLVELPAYLVAVRVVDAPSIGRRGTAGGGLALGGACCMLSVFVLGDPGSPPKVAMLFLVFLGKFGIAMGFATIYLYAAELFPTTIRSRAMGLQSLAARVGGMLSSIVASWGQQSRALPLIVFGLPCFLAGVMALCGLPETRGKPMLNTIEDLGPSRSSGRGAARALPWFVRRYNQLGEDTVRDGVAPDKLGASPSFG